MSKKQWPCSIDEGRVKQCWALDEVLQLPGGRGTRSQGVEAQTMVNTESFEFSRNLIVLKSGKHGKKGLVMNLCPFCGGELVEGARAKLAERDAKWQLPPGARAELTEDRDDSASNIPHVRQGEP